MIHFLLAAVQAGSPQGDAAAPIVAASLFKNGYAMVRREVKVFGTTTSLTQIPQSSLGTFWLTTTGDLKIKSVVVANEILPAKYTAGNLSQLFDLNKGKPVKLTTVSLGVIEGTLVGRIGDLVQIRTKDNNMVFSFGEIRLATFGADMVTTGASQTVRRVLRFATEGSGAIIMLGLERGMSWAPGYALDISDGKTLTLTAKATIVNDLSPLKNLEVRLVTGFPNIPWAHVTEPLLSPAAVAELNNALKSAAPGAFARNADARFMNMQSQSPSELSQAFDPNLLAGEEAGDLFFYRQPDVTLAPGDRGLYLLFEAKSDFEHLYTCEISTATGNSEQFIPAPDGPVDVWHKLRFKNTAEQPLSTGPATVFSKGQVVGQDTLSYTARGQTATVTISKALDVRVESSEEEVERTREVIKRGSSNYTYDLITIKGTIQATNMKGEAIRLDLTRTVRGEVISMTHEGAATKAAKGLRDLNPQSVMKWAPKLAKGEKAEIGYTYKIYIPA